MISVIIPIFNVESFLPKCLDSLTTQTFPNVEFILIDDGSIDKSGEIAESYVEADSRFIIYHTDNHGLSAARNLGIKKSHGEWLMFVDSDDYVTPDFCETPYQAALQKDADMVIFKSSWETELDIELPVSRYRIKGLWTQNSGHNKNHLPANYQLPEIVCSRQFARKNIQLMLDGKIVDTETAIRYGGVTVWNKLYRRELFNSICYPTGRVYEDIATTHKLIYTAKRILMLPNVLYYQVPRKNSITHIRSVKYSEDAFIASLERAEYLKSHGCAEDLYQPDVWSRALKLLALAKPGDNILFKRAEAVVDSISGIPPQLNRKKRLMLIVWKADKRLFHFICRILGQKDKNA